MTSKHTPKKRIIISTRPGLLCDSLQVFLSNPSYEVIAVNNISLQETLEQIENHSPEVFIMDVTLNPDKRQWLQQIHQLHPQINVIALVGSIKQQQEVLEWGAMTAFLKGNLGEELRQAILAPGS